MLLKFFFKSNILYENKNKNEIKFKFGKHFVLKVKFIFLKILVSNSERSKKKIAEYFGFELCKYNKFYSKTPNTTFKNFAKPLNVEILSLFSNLTKVSKDLLFLMQGKNLFLSSLKTSQYKI